MDIFTTPLLTARDTAWHLGMPESTLDAWLAPGGGEVPLVHSVEPVRRGWPRVPFVGVVEAHALRELRRLGIPMREIRRIVAILREEFDDPHALASRRIGALGDAHTLGGGHARLFARLSDESLVDQHRQTAFREALAAHLRFVAWDDAGQPAALRLSQYPDQAEVVIDPRFGWGAPVIAANKIPVSAVVDLWRAGEPMDAVAEEFELSRDVVEDICRAAA